MFWAASALLGGSCVVISGVIRPLILVIIIDTLLLAPLITTHEPCFLLQRKPESLKAPGPGTALNPKAQSNALV